MEVRAIALEHGHVHVSDHKRCPEHGQRGHGGRMRMNDRLNVRAMTIDPKMKASRRIWDTMAINHVQVVINANEIAGTGLIEANSERKS